MFTKRDLSSFVMYWFLTYIFGTLCLAYYVLCRLLGRNTDSIDEEKDKKMQPPCLYDATYGNHKFFKSQGVKIHYVDSGEKSAKVVLLIHGIPGFWFCWRKQIQELSDHFRVVAIDLRGCGDSEAPSARESYSKDKIILDLVYLIGCLGCASVNVVCCETSGHLGWELASSYSHIVSKLVVINAPHPAVLYHLFHVRPCYYFKYWYLLLLQIPMLPEVITSKDQTNGWLQSLLDPPTKAKVISEDEIEAYKYTFSRKGDWKGVINHLRQIDLRPFGERHQTEIITSPTLLIMGSSHPYLTVESAYRSAELVERIKVKIIQNSNAGNNIQVTHSKQINEELISFLVDAQSHKSSKSDPKPSLVGRVLGAVTSPYAKKNSDVGSLSNGLKEAAQNTLNSGVNFAQTVWPSNYNKPAYNNKVSQIIF